MNTRFDSDEWITAQGEYILVSNLETSHLINILKMFIKQPLRTISMLIKDIERLDDHTRGDVWSKNNRNGVKKESIREITKMKPEECVEYALTSTLGVTMLKELNTRGVDVKNIITFMKEGE